jgi:hypothetical protein
MLFDRLTWYENITNLDQENILKVQPNDISKLPTTNKISFSFFTKNYNHSYMFFKIINILTNIYTLNFVKTIKLRLKNSRSFRRMLKRNLNKKKKRKLYYIFQIYPGNYKLTQIFLLYFPIIKRYNNLNKFLLVSNIQLKISDLLLEQIEFTELVFGTLMEEFYTNIL